MVKERLQIRWGANPAATRACAGSAVDLGLFGIAAPTSHRQVTLPLFRARLPLESSP